MLRKRGLLISVMCFILFLLLTLILTCDLNLDYDRYAIVYGISDYTHPGISDLNYCDDDAVSIKDLLEEQGYEVTMRTDGGATGATMTNLTTDFNDIKSKVKSEDLFLFYFSGHGSYGSLPQDDEEPPTANDYVESIVLNEALTYDLLTDDELGNMMADIPCHKKVVILDTCHSGGFIGNTLETDSLSSAIELYANFSGEEYDISPYNALVISAAGEMESSYEAGLPYNHGIFTYYLLKAAEYGDKNNDGYITVLEAYYYTGNKIAQDINFSFSPQVSGGAVDFLLFDNN